MIAAAHPLFRLIAGAALGATVATACEHTSNSTGPSSSVNGFSLSIDSGSNLQLAVVGHTIHVAVTLTNANGASVNGQTTSWIAETGGGSLSAASTTTDANGHTSTDWTLGTAAGTNTLTATVAGAVVTITATGAPGALRGLTKASADPQTVVATASASFIVRAVDQFNNPIPGIVVDWTSSAGSLASTSSTTGTSGNAQTTLTTDAVPNVYTITATTSGFAPVTFTLIGR
jgi:adhesin/invasin